MKLQEIIISTNVTDCTFRSVIPKAISFSVGRTINVPKHSFVCTLKQKSKRAAKIIIN